MKLLIAYTVVSLCLGIPLARAVWLIFTHIKAHGLWRTVEGPVLLLCYPCAAVLVAWSFHTVFIHLFH